MAGPRRYSRHLYSLGFHDDEPDGSEGPLMLTEREPFTYRVYADNREHIVSQGETLFTLAAKYLSPIPRAAGLWWVIADFQPDPIHDPTIQLTPGTTIVIPSVRTVLEAVFSESRRLEAGL
jgi:hypothetical protein